MVYSTRNLGNLVIFIESKIIIYLKRIKEHTYSSTESNSSRNYFLLIETVTGKFENLSIYYNNKPSETTPTEQEQQIVSITKTDSYKGLSRYFQKVLITDNEFKNTINFSIFSLLEFLYSSYLLKKSISVNESII